MIQQPAEAICILGSPLYSSDHRSGGHTLKATVATVILEEVLSVFLEDYRSMC